MLSDIGGVRTFKHSTPDGTFYHVHEIQNGVTMETRTYTAQGVLSSTITYRFPNNTTIRDRMPGFTVGNNETYQLLSESPTTMVVRRRTTTNGVLTGQTDTHYARVSLPLR